MSDEIIKEPRDDYKEHELHKKPYWQNMETCSTCYSEHIRVKQEFGSLAGHSQETENALKMMDYKLADSER